MATLKKLSNRPTGVPQAAAAIGDGFGLAVQWYPEAGEDLRVIDALVSAARLP